MDFSRLNEAQLQAVTAPDGPMLLVAGAGTGKTNTLVHRLAWLIEQGVEPREIVLLTFTRRAANEMLERAEQLVGAQAQKVRGGTFHSFANRVLRRWASRVGYGNDFTILDQSDAEALVGLCRSELGAGGGDRRFPKRNTVLKVLSKAVNTGKPIAELLEESYPQYLEEADDIERIGKRYAERKKQQNVVDYDDLLVLLLKLLKEHDDVRTRISSECRHVLVDEYQDTNRLQAQIALLMAMAHGNLVVVGDEAQSIYGFRGAVVDNILDFPKLMPGCRVIKLEQNYRSVQPVLDLANDVLDGATRGYDKRLFTREPGGDRPRFVEVPALDDEPAYVVREVLKLRELGVELQDIAVLFRSAFHANLLELELNKANIPFRKFGGIQFVEAAHIKDLFSLLRILSNPRDGLAWFRVLQWFEGLGHKTARTMMAQITESIPPKLDIEKYRKRRYGPGLIALGKMLAEAQPKLDDLPALIEHVLDYYKHKLRDLYEDARKRERDLETLQLLGHRFADLETFLTEVALDPPNKAEATAADSEDEWLTLSTIHSAKGLEWHTVFVLGLRDGRFPSPYVLDDADAMEEERRLFYVAITRAREGLHLMHPRTIRGQFFTPSCAFIDELPDPDRVQQVLWAPDTGEVEPNPEMDAAKKRMAAFLDYFS